MAAVERVLSAGACVRRWSRPALRGEFPTRADLEVIDVARGVVPQDDWDGPRYMRATVADRQTRVYIATLHDFRIFELVHAPSAGEQLSWESRQSWGSSLKQQRRAHAVHARVLKRMLFRADRRATGTQRHTPASRHTSGTQRRGSGTEPGGRFVITRYLSRA